MSPLATNFAIRLSTRIALKHDLSYKSRIALREMVTILIDEGISKKKLRKLIETFFKHLSFINHPPLLVIPDPQAKRR